MPGFSVLPIYGGQGYGPQLHALRRGVHVVVGTPGRVIDHLTRGSLDLSELRCLVLDEADEMLRMGFIRSEEHTSELQSLMRISYAVFCLKKKNKNKQHTYTRIND